jgi:hypothetical protein
VQISVEKLSYTFRSGVALFHHVNSIDCQAIVFGPEEYVQVKALSLYISPASVEHLSGVRAGKYGNGGPGLQWVGALLYLSNTYCQYAAGQSCPCGRAIHHLPGC